MESIYFALGAVAAALVVHWAWSADCGGKGAQAGLLAMRKPQPELPAANRRGRRRPK
jgi:hypothetical protein